MMEGSSYSVRYLLCKRRLSKAVFVFLVCVALALINMVMVRKTPLKKITSAFCVDQQPADSFLRSAKGENQADMMSSILTSSGTNQSTTDKVLLAMKKLLQSETYKTEFIEWASKYFTNPNLVHIEEFKPQVESGTNISGNIPDTKYHIEDTRRKDVDNETVEIKQPLDVTSNKGTCPNQPPDLIGAIAGNQEQTNMEALNSLFNNVSPDDKYSALEMGGHSKPKECIAVQKLAILIPYRNRYPHLLVLLHNLIPFLRRQQSDFQIFIIEQNLPTTFNRGMLQNVGYLEALKLGQFDCFVFHDVDMLPLNDRCLYRCKDNPLHLTAAISKWRYGLPYGSYFGGVTAFSKEQYRNINGNSNLYFGWGGEDDDLKARITAKGYKMIRYPNEIGRYDMIKHTRDAGNNANPDRLRLLKTSTNRQGLEGLSTTVYNVTKVEYKPLITWIYVSIDMNKVLETAPAMTKSAISSLLRQAKNIPKTAR